MSSSFGREKSRDSVPKAETLCALARPHLTNPAWTLEAAARQGYLPQWWPEQYLSGKSQLERNVQRAQASESRV